MNKILKIIVYKNIDIFVIKTRYFISLGFTDSQVHNTNKKLAFFYVQYRTQKAGVI